MKTRSTVQCNWLGSEQQNGSLGKKIQEFTVLSLQDVDKPCDVLLQQVSIEEILEEQRLQQQTKQETEKVKMQVLKDRGLSIPKADNLDEY